MQLVALLLLASVSHSGAQSSAARSATKPAAQVEREVSFPGFEGLELAGTLTLPPLAADRAPAVLLLPGSGPTDRNGNQPPGLITDLLKQIAARLASEGFCVLRFDKRAAHHYKAVWPTDDARLNEFFRWEAFVGDAQLALAFLRAQPEVDGKRVAVFGHSEGGLIALQMASDLAGSAESPAALVLAATAGTTYQPLIRFQVSSALALQGASDELKQQLMTQLDAAMKQVLEQGTVPADLHPGLRALFPVKATKLLRAYYQTDPTVLAKRFGADVLIVHGEKDAQVPAKEHSALLLEALRARESGKVELLLVADGSHNLKKTTGPQDLGFSGPVVPAALDGIAAFLKKTLGR